VPQQLLLCLSRLSLLLLLSLALLLLLLLLIRMFVRLVSPNRSTREASRPPFFSPEGAVFTFASHGN
jgi:hypothetical protein